MELALYVRPRQNSARYFRPFFVHFYYSHLVAPFIHANLSDYVVLRRLEAMLRVHCIVSFSEVDAVRLAKEG